MICGYAGLKPQLNGLLAFFWNPYSRHISPMHWLWKVH